MGGAELQGLPIAFTESLEPGWHQNRGDGKDQNVPAEIFTSKLSCFAWDLIIPAHKSIHGGVRTCTGFGEGLIFLFNAWDDGSSMVDMQIAASSL